MLALGAFVRNRWHRWAWLCALVLLQALPLRAEQASLRAYGQAEGLANLAVTTLARDGAGFIWVGTQNGVYRFDGARFERIGTAEIGYVMALVADGDRLWVGTSDGVWLWQDGGLQPVQPPGEPLAIDDPQAILPVDGTRAWVASGGRLFQIVRSGAGWQRQDGIAAALATLPKMQQHITSVVRAAHGALWLGCGPAICRLDERGVVAWGAERGVQGGPWRSLLLAADGALWARSARRVLQLEAGASAFADRSEKRDEDDRFDRYPLAEDAQHRIISASRGGLMRWNGRSWDRFDTAPGLPIAGRVMAVLTDHEGGLWFGKLGAGLQQWRGYGRWENWTVAGGLPHHVVWSFARAGKPARLLAATGAGVVALDPATQRFRPVEGTAGKEAVALSRAADGALWVGTRTGALLRLPGGGGAIATLPGSPKLYRLFADRAGRLWVLDGAGLRRWDPGAGSFMPQAVQPGGSPFSDVCEAGDGALWFSGAAGVVRLAGEHWGAPQRLDIAPELVACLRDGSVVVAGARGGLYRLHAAGPALREKPGAALRAEDITPPALRGRTMLALLGDSRGWLWAATDAGVAVWNGRHWRLLGSGQGLVWDDTSAYALFEDEDASIWIGTSRGASHVVAPASLFDAAMRAPIVRVLRRGGQALPPDGAIDLPWSRDALETVLALPSYRDRAAQGVEYRLAGFDERWTASPHPDIRLTGLPPGSYRFDARVVDRELGIVSAPASFGFSIAPPWWGTLWARAGFAGLTLLLAYAAYRWRVRALTQQEQRLHALVQERTRELEASREQLREQATKDVLTGIWNRRALMEILERDLARCQRERQPLALVLADIDHFKQVNDRHGHSVGDAVLREFAVRLASGLRPCDAVGRYGGEEFMLILPGLDLARAEDRARLIAIHAVIAAAPMAVGTVTCSFGAAGHDGARPVAVGALIEAADQALYRAKRQGRDRVDIAAESTSA
ncbi:diguanylate cyclase [Aquabacterium sp.]|uniref:diguanylate cyclase n=1 Tax=Aquabacterium sp. TaxID=1872578 RepID=UPI002BCB9DBB|nr:diguanylate cyclase [Aquabacterium sp.]HSW04375.1 diguanylate cyclase [Aquabacterium sp.]